MSLAQLGIDVSTGPIIPYRNQADLREWPADHHAPLLYPHHLKDSIDWPCFHKRRPNSIEINYRTKGRLWPPGWYVVTRRISPNEEVRRVRAYVIRGDQFKTPIGFVDLLNVFHCGKEGLDCYIAQGLCAYLNSTRVDRAFRELSGSTQVNVSDLKAILYPTRRALQDLGMTFGDRSDSVRVDEFLENEL